MTAVPLQFEHKMAKVIVEAQAVASSGVTTINSITLHSVMPSVSFNTNTGEVSTAEGTPVDVKLVKDGDAGTASGAAAIPAQTIEGTLLTIVTNLGTATYAVDSKDFVAGRVYKLRLTVTRAQVNATTHINGWTEGGIMNYHGSSFLTFTVGSVSFKMIFVEGGDFTLTYGNRNYSNSSSPNNVTVTGTLSDYYIGQTEVTNALWVAVMGGTAPSESSKADDFPVSNITWPDISGSSIEGTDASCFLKKLNDAVATQLPLGMKFKLPTEAQWGYAAKGGKHSNGYTYGGSDTIGDVAWYTENSTSKSHAVGTKPANELGLYDISGNSWEWCQDWYAEVPAGSIGKDYVNTTESSWHVYRGGGWRNIAVECTVSYRSYGTLTYKTNNVGLRLVLQ
jgi:formylglycine-generating enzyme required for sulfatase activity